MDVSLVGCTVEDGVAVVRLQDEANHNALSAAMVVQFERVVRDICARSDVRVIVLTGVREYFCTGAAREVLEGLSAGDVAPADLLLPRLLLDVPVPVIAAMEGHALSGGLAIALCADIIVAASESRYGCNFMNYGFTPGVGTTQLLAYVIGPLLAHEMLLTGSSFRGSHLRDRGVFNYILRRDEVVSKALALASAIAEKPLQALTALKTVLSAPKRQIFESARTTEILMHRLTLTQPEVADRIAGR